MWAVKGDLGMVGVVRTLQPIAESPSSVVERILLADRCAPKEPDAREQATLDDLA
jgi:hypothetical protein